MRDSFRTKNDWTNYYGRMIGTRLAAEVPYNKISPVFYSSTDTMKLRWGSLQKMESEMLFENCHERGSDRFV